MKKINAFLFIIFLITLFSCDEANTKYVTAEPKVEMSALQFSPTGSNITGSDEINIYAPQEASDAVIYYEIAVGTNCPEPTTESAKYNGPFTLSSKELSANDGDFITLKALAMKAGFENKISEKHWNYSDGSAPEIDDNAYLKSVTISGVSFEFSYEKFVYDIDVPNNIKTVDIAYEKSNKNAAVNTSPTSLKGIPLTVGETTLVSLTVKSSDGSTTKRYSFNIYRGKDSDNIQSSDNFLASLSVEGASFEFDKNQQFYDVQLPNSKATTSVTYTLSNSNATVAVRLDGTPSSLEAIKNISIAEGETKRVSIEVKAENGETLAYIVKIYRKKADALSDDATLKSLSVTGGSLSFSSSVTDYDVEIPSDYTGTVSVEYERNYSGAKVVSTPSNLSNIPVVAGSTTDVIIEVTAENGVAKKTYKIKLTKKKGVSLSSNANLSSITVSDGSLSPSFSSSETSYFVNVGKDVSSITVNATAEDSKANVNITPSSPVALEAGKTKLITIKVTAEDGTPKDYTVSVRRAGDLPPQPDNGKYYWTNKDGAVGTNKTISSWSDWTEAERIAQCAAYDDPRTWTGIQEVPYDVYALYAAYDDTNLYLMVELTNIVDRANFMFHDFAASDNAWWNNRNIPLGMLFNTGKGASATKPTVGTTNKPIWDAVDFSDSNGFDAMFYHSSKYGEFNGEFVGVGNPGYFKTTPEGVFSYDKSSYCLSFNGATTEGTSGISVKYQRQCAVSKTIYFESTPNDNRNTSGQDGKSLMESTTYKSVETNNLDMSYWYTIPLSTLGITKDYIQTIGIGVRQLTTGGGSLMDCCPWDKSMVDVAGEYYSGADDYSSKEKEDVDEMTSALARIGCM